MKPNGTEDGPSNPPFGYRIEIIGSKNRSGRDSETGSKMTPKNDPEMGEFSETRKSKIVLWLKPRAYFATPARSKTCHANDTKWEPK